MQLPRQYRAYFSVDSDPTPTATRGLRVGHPGETFRTDALAALDLIERYPEGRGSHLGVAQQSSPAVLSSDCRHLRIKLVPVTCGSEAEACRSYLQAIRSLGKSHRLHLSGSPQSMTYEGMRAWLVATPIRAGTRSWLVPAAIAASIAAILALLLLQTQPVGLPVHEEDRNTLFVVDVGDTMNRPWRTVPGEERPLTYIDTARRMLHRHVRTMPEDFAVNIVLFNEEAQALLPSVAPLNEAARAALRKRIDDMEAKKDTRLEPALNEVFRQLEALPAGTQATVKLYTAAAPALGERTLAELLDLVRKRNRGPGATIDVYGFGGLRERAQSENNPGLAGYVDFLETLASESGGSFHDLGQPGEIASDTSLLGRARVWLDDFLHRLKHPPSAHTQGQPRGEPQGELRSFALETGCSVPPMAFGSKNDG